MKSNDMEWPMHRDVSQQQSAEHADETLRALVRLLARVAAREALAATPQADEEHQHPLPDEGDEDAE